VGLFDENTRKAEKNKKKVVKRLIFLLGIHAVYVRVYGLRVCMDTRIYFDKGMDMENM
jgi:hypothetical protein